MGKLPNQLDFYVVTMLSCSIHLSIENMNNIKRTKMKKRSSDGERFAVLAQLDENVFHACDLANLWNIKKRSTLYQTLSRYLKRGLLFRVHNGLYAIKKTGEFDPFFLGLKALHRPAYVSCESVLYEQGIINQRPSAITIVSSVSKVFTVSQIRFKSRQMKDEYLFNESGIEMTGGVRKASVERAVADMLYFNPQKYLDVGHSKMIKWSEVRKINKAVGYKINI
jgi:predicted transcriptional regulator of viral defense system